MKWILLTVALLLGFAGGYLLAPKSAESIAPEEVNWGIQTSNPLPDEDRSTQVSRETGGSDTAQVTVQWLERVGEMDSFDQIGALHQRLRNLGAADFPSLMDEIKDQPNDMVNWQSRSMIAARWAQMDPQGMLAYAQNTSSQTSWSLYNTLFSAWAKEDVNAAFQAAKELGNRRSQQSATQAVFNAVSAENPAQAVQMAKEFYGNRLGSDGRWVLQSIYRNWSRQDGAAARAAALSMPDGVAKSTALSGALGDWMDEDPVAALDWLDSLPMDSSVYGSRKEVFRQFINRDLDVAREYIESIGNPVDRREILESVHFSNMSWKKSYEEIEEVFDWLGTVATGQVYDSRVSGIISAMAENDPDRAVDFVLNLPPGNARMNGLNSIGSKLVEMDPQRAFEFVDSLHYEDEKRRALGSMGWRLSQQGIESSSELIANSEDPLIQQQLAQRVSGEWSNYDVAGALAWSESLADESARKSAVRAVFNNWIETDPSAALSYVETSVDAGAQVSVLRNAYSNWARNDPQAAAEALGQLPESVEDDRGQIYRGVTDAYINHDPMAASEWISTLDEGPERDQSVEALVSNISRTDPEAGFMWAATMGDEEKRKDSLRRSVREWAKTDPDAALSAIKSAQIEAAEKEPLLKMLDK